MQIAQFVIGFTFAALHLFISYSVPVSTPYQVASSVNSGVSAVSSAASSVLSNPAAATAATAGAAAFLKKLVLRAAGEEGLAENVRNEQGQLFGPEARHLIDSVTEETRWRDEYQTIPCIDTTGEAFAVWLNLIYLLPLT